MLVAVFPVALALVLKAASRKPPDASDFLEFDAMVVLQFVVPFCALMLGVAALGDDIDGRTITYLFTRPLPRWVFLVGRVTGFSLGFGAVVAASVYALTLVFRDALAFGATRTAGTVGIAVAGFFAYAAFFALLRTLFRRALFIGFLIAFVSEVMISKLPVALLSRLSLWHHLVLLQVRLQETPPSAIGNIAPGIASDEQAMTSVIVVAAVWLVSLVAGSILICRREVSVPAAVAQ